MTTNQIKYVVTVNGEPKEVTFTNRDIEMGSGKIFENNAMVAETLEADTIDVIINMQPAQTKTYKLMDVDGINLLDVNGKQLRALDSMRHVDPSAFLYGETIKYYRDGVLDGKFYARQARQIGKYRYSVEGISAVGLLIRRQHNGGMYFNARTGDIIADIMGDIPYTIEDDVADLLVSGWLPAQSARDNLQQILFSCGASISKNSDKDIHIMFMGNESVIFLPNSRVYSGGRVNYRNQVTAVEVTEHSFIAFESDPATTLFDSAEGGFADHTKVIFDSPVHDLVATGLTIHESNCNYAIISGTGTLTGQNYTHTQKVVRRETGQIAEENIMTVADAYMVTGLNSANVSKRVANYYGRIHETSIGVVMGTDGIKPTAKIQFTNPFGSVALGYIRSSDKVMSGVVRSDLAVVTDWTPGPFGSNFKYWELVTSSGIWTVPENVNNIRVTLIGGGFGGYGGYDGEPGHDGGTGPAVNTERHAEPGEGGAPGPDGGTQGRVSIYDVAVTPGQTFNIAIGEGGDGGDGGEEPAEGEEGTPTTFGGMSSATGIPAFVVNLFTGEIYGERGDADGIPGGTFPGSLAYKGATYNSAPVNDTTSTYYIREGSTTIGSVTGVYGNGSGPAAGSDGHDGAAPRFEVGYLWRELHGGAGGPGADAIAPDAETHIGKGGRAGNGGGGGGGGGGIGYRQSTGIYTLVGGAGGRGGYGSAGGKGGPGGVLIYW